MPMPFLFFKKQRELDVKELLSKASKSPEDYLKVIGKVEHALKEKRAQNNEDKGFFKKVHDVIVGLRGLVWAKDANATMLKDRVDLNELDSILDKLKNNSWRIERPVVSPTPEKKSST